MGLHGENQRRSLWTYQPPPQPQRRQEAGAGPADLLGGRPDDPALYDETGRVDYERVRATEPFRRGLDRLLAELDRHTVALLCSEEDPLDCHRGLMITPALAEMGIVPGHLRRDGTVESTAALERRRLHETGVGAGLVDGLFAAVLGEAERRELLTEAYRMRARQKAYRRATDDAGESGA